MYKRRATHAGSWYSSNPDKLAAELDGWLDVVPKELDEISAVPLPSGRAIIVPHAGYAYSGATAAYGYKALDVSKAKHVFVLGPSHHLYVQGCCITQFTELNTPFGSLVVDENITQALYGSGKFALLAKDADEAEHSIELHLPYIYHMLSKTFEPADFPTVIPILVGSTTVEMEKAFGEALAPFLIRPDCVFVVSSDFCHWGSRFQYTYYLPADHLDGDQGINLKSKHSVAQEWPIHKSIGHLDQLVMQSIESGNYHHYCHILKQTGNTVCGRHPIGVFMCAMEHLRGKFLISSLNSGFRFLHYERSNDAIKPTDSSVSYASAITKLEKENVGEEGDGEGKKDDPAPSLT